MRKKECTNLWVLEVYTCLCLLILKFWGRERFLSLELKLKNSWPWRWEIKFSLLVSLWLGFIGEIMWKSCQVGLTIPTCRRYVWANDSSIIILFLFAVNFIKSHNSRLNVALTLLYNSAQYETLFPYPWNVNNIGWRKTES